MPLTIRFRRFWPGFDPHEFFVPLIERVAGRPARVVADAGADVDVAIDSVFPPGRRPWSALLPSLRPDRPGAARLRLWFTGENVRPPATGYDGTLSFDVDDHGGTNAYLPLPFLGLTWFDGAPRPLDSGEARRIRARPTPRDLASPRQPQADRPLFACAFIGRPEPTRMRVVEALRSVGPVDVYGPGVGRPVESKTDVATEYRFMLCLENAVHPGYVTEKAIEAWWCGCVPVWSGSDRAGLLNPDALLNLQDFDGIAALVAEVARIDATPDLWRAIQCRPIARSTWTLEPVEAFLADRMRRAGLLGSRP